MPNSSGYSKLSGIYDTLGTIVFGRSLERSANHFLTKELQAEELLILGGGTGRVLLHLNNIKFSGRVTFIDSSPGMIEKAKRRKTSFEVAYRCEKFETLQLDTRFDAIHAAFFLDQFKDMDQVIFLKKMNEISLPQSLWMITDFVSPGSAFQHILMGSMYLFFRMVTGIEAKRLPDIFGWIESSGQKIIEERYFYRGLIRCCLIAR